MMTINMTPIKQLPDTSDVDAPAERDFRNIVRTYRPIGFGRMAQIISEEWRRYSPRSGGLLFVCPKCDELYIYDWRITVKKYIKEFFGK